MSQDRVTSRGITPYAAPELASTTVAVYFPGQKNEKIAVFFRRRQPEIRAFRKVWEP